MADEPADPDDSKPGADSLRGKLLIASPALLDPNFARSVILMTDHDNGGAMGIVLNRPSDTSVGEAVPALAEIAGAEESVFTGGPVQTEALLVLGEFSDLDAAAWLVTGDVGFATSEFSLKQIAASTRRARVYAGYSGWGPGQLEAELEAESWIVDAPLPAELFAPEPGDLWAAVLERKGGSFALLSRIPDDPSLN